MVVYTTGISKSHTPISILLNFLPEALLPSTSLKGERCTRRPLDADVVVGSRVQGIFFLAVVLEGLQYCVSSVLVLRNAFLRCTRTADISKNKMSLGRPFENTGGVQTE